VPREALQTLSRVVAYGVDMVVVDVLCETERLNRTAYTAFGVWLVWVVVVVAVVVLHCTHTHTQRWFL
jgi:hypothetical protein